MLNGDGNENGKKSMSNSQIISLRVQRTLFAVVLHDYNVNRPPSCTFYAGNVVSVPVRFYFFTAAHFHRGGR